MCFSLTLLHCAFKVPPAIDFFLPLQWPHTFTLQAGTPCNSVCELSLLLYLYFFTILAIFFYCYDKYQNQEQLMEERASFLPVPDRMGSMMMGKAREQLVAEES